MHGECVGIRLDCVASGAAQSIGWDVWAQESQGEGPCAVEGFYTTPPSSGRT